MQRPAAPHFDSLGEAMMWEDLSSAEQWAVIDSNKKAKHEQDEQDAKVEAERQNTADLQREELRKLSAYWETDEGTEQRKQRREEYEGMKNREWKKESAAAAAAAVAEEAAAKKYQRGLKRRSM